MQSTKTNILLILDGCIQGNRKAQRRFFEHFYGLIKKTCNRYADTKEQSDEMLNDSFYQIFRSLERYDPERNITPWIIGITIKCCLMHQRKYFEKLPTFELHPSEEIQDSDNWKFWGDDNFDYLQLLRHLPKACRIIINLFVIEEYKHQEIAQMLSITVGTSKSNLHRAKKLLADMLEKDNKGHLKLKSAYE